MKNTLFLLTFFSIVSLTALGQLSDPSLGPNTDNNAGLRKMIRDFNQSNQPIDARSFFIDIKLSTMKIDRVVIDSVIRSLAPVYRVAEKFDYDQVVLYIQAKKYKMIIRVIDLYKHPYE